MWVTFFLTLVKIYWQSSMKRYIFIEKTWRQLWAILLHFYIPIKFWFDQLKMNLRLHENLWIWKNLNFFIRFILADFKAQNESLINKYLQRSLRVTLRYLSHCCVLQGETASYHDNENGNIIVISGCNRTERFIMGWGMGGTPPHLISHWVLLRKKHQHLSLTTNERQEAVFPTQFKLVLQSCSQFGQLYKILPRCTFKNWIAWNGSDH